jgi:transposase
MTKMTDDTIGIEISKATLDIHRLSDAKTMSFGNCPTGFKLLAKFYAKTSVKRVAYEAIPVIDKAIHKQNLARSQGN